MRNRPQTDHDIPRRFRDMLFCEGDFVDSEVARESERIDAKADRDWFVRHPGQTTRQRPASALERRAAIAPDASTVDVTLQDNGVIFRHIFWPASR